MLRNYSEYLYVNKPDNFTEVKMFLNTLQPSENKS